MKRFAYAFFLLALFCLVAFFDAPVKASSLPEVVFLGKGPGAFTTPLDNFIVKVKPFDFDWEPGPDFEAEVDQRVWGVRGANEKPPKLWHEEVNLGAVEAGCVSKYVGIDDDLDGRINVFRLNGEIIETVSEGMVFGGSFVIPRDGNLTFVADDSVAGWFDKCSEQIKPTATPTGTATETPAPTVTNTPPPTETATPGPSPTATNTPPPTETATPGPSPTGTSTPLPPTVTATPIQPTPEPTATATKRPRDHACLRINFDVGGHHARRGLYVVQEIGGHFLASWYAEDGWMDSGWIKELNITHENVYVQVLYYSGPGASPVELKILNHAPDSPYGWLSWGICHALEVAWPEGIDEQSANIDTAPEIAEESAAAAQPAAHEETAVSAEPDVETNSLNASLSGD